MKSGVVDPRTLIANPANHRKHDAQQLAAVEGLLKRYGFVEGIVVNRRSGRIVNGHARVEIAIKIGAKSVPVTWADLDDDAEALALASMDAIGDMAGIDTGALADLIVSAKSEEVDAVVEAVDGLRNVRDGATGTRGKVAIYLDPDAHVEFLSAVDKIARATNETRTESVVLRAMREAFA